MSNKIVLSHDDINALAHILSNKISAHMAGTMQQIVRIHPVPRGGVPVAYALRKIPGLVIVDNPEFADIIVDDLVDSGATRLKFAVEYPNAQFMALIDKTTQPEFFGKWIVFPWEKNESSGIEDNVRRLLQFSGDDASREGLDETPARVAKAYKHWFSGYNVDIPKLLKVFEDGGETYNQMVIVKDIPIYSKCEHHMADIFGTATIAYIPNGKIVGLSKLSRLADAFARRLQVQERLTEQIADALDLHLGPKGVGVIIRARHMCMESRGVCQQGHHTITTALRGEIYSDPQARSEFLMMAK